MYEALLKFPKGWGGVRKKIPSVGKVWIFSGTVHIHTFFRKLRNFQYFEILSKSNLLEITKTKPMHSIMHSIMKINTNLKILNQRKNS